MVWVPCTEPTHPLSFETPGASSLRCLPARQAGRAGSEELDSLGERQIGSVVDGVRRAPHVGLPRVRPRLAAAAGVLLAPECAADLGAGRPEVDVGDAAVRPGRG